MFHRVTCTQIRIEVHSVGCIHGVQACTGIMVRNRRLSNHGASLMEHLTRARFAFTGNLVSALTFLRPPNLEKPTTAPVALSPLHLTQMNFWKLKEGRNGAPISERTLARRNILKGESGSGTRAPRVIRILHSSAPIDLEHNVASRQTNVAIINTVSGQPSACFTQHLTHRCPGPAPPRPAPSSGVDSSRRSIHNH